MSKKWCPFLAGLAIALTTSVITADGPNVDVPSVPPVENASKRPPETFFVRIDSLPVSVGETFPGRVLHRGEPVQVLNGENQNFVAIQFGTAKNSARARVPFWTLSRTKPPAKAQVTKPSSNKEAAADLDRMKGTWGPVACSILGHLNPSDYDAIDIHGVEIRGTARNTLNANDLLPRAFGDCFHFSDQRLTTWYVTPSVDENGKLQDGPHDRGTWELRVDPRQHPKHLDVVFRIDGDIVSVAPGIYEFDGGFLKWAQAPQVLLKGDPGELPDGVERHRPRGFDEKRSRKSVVVWLSRLDEREFPSPASNAPALGVPDGTGAPLPTEYVCVDTLPVGTGGNFPGHLLHRGDAVQANDNYGENILFKASGKWVDGGVLCTALSPSKQRAIKAPTEALPAKTEDISDLERLRGTWQLVSWSLLGHRNPSLTELGTMTVVVPDVGNGTHRMSALQAVPQNFFRFTESAAVAWNILPVADPKDSAKVHQEAFPVYGNRYTFRLDSAAKPKHLDLIQSRGTKFTITTPGIYEFDGELLKWARACRMPGGIDDPDNPPERLRPKAFGANESDCSVVLWLSRVNKQDVPAFPGPQPTKRPPVK